MSGEEEAKHSSIRLGHPGRGTFPLKYQDILRPLLSAT